MTLIAALRLGLRALSLRKRMWLLFYGVTTLWALAVVAPVIALLLATLGESAWASGMAGNFDVQFIAELIFGKSAGLSFTTLMAAGAAVFAVAAIAHVFLLGGAIQLFCAHEPFSPAAFFDGCGRHFWRFVRLALVSALFYVAVMGLSRGLNGLGNEIWGEGSVQTPLIYWDWFRTALVLVLFGLVNLCFDYARIRLVAEDSRKAFRGAMASIRFVFRNFRRTAGLYAVLWASLLAILLAYRGAAELLAQPTLGIVIVLFLIRQITVIAHTGMQLVFYSSQSEMYLALAPPKVVSEEPMEAGSPLPEPEAAAEPIAPAPELLADETPTTPEPER